MIKDLKIPILAKPSGITLEQHRFDVMSEAMLYMEKHSFIKRKYLNRVGKDLRRRLLKVCELHDEGKASEWNDACQKDYQAYLEWQAKNTCLSFKKYVMQVGEEAAKNIRKCKVRHEFKSVQIAKLSKCPEPLLAAIAAHHGKLCYKYDERLSAEANEIWSEFQLYSNEVINKKDIVETAKNLYEYSALRGLLQLIDHRASAKEDNEIVPEFNCFDYKFPFSNKREVQKLVEQNSDKDLLLLRAPTGAGKTDASLLWASLQIEKGRADRMVIAMPTRFTSNALSISISKDLSEVGLYHSSAWNVYAQKDNFEKNIIEKQQEFARLLETPVTVCTIDHLLMSLTLMREDHHLTTFNLANSCLVIDEADFYDDFTQENIFVLLEILKLWDVPILLMSASLPEISINEYRKTGYNVDKIIEDTSDEERERFELKEMRDYSSVDEVEDLLYLMLEKGTGIVYANTIEHACIFYNWFKIHDSNLDVVLYHSRFVEPDKARKENELISILGKNAWESNRAKGIAILTQIGEMSINISCDIMISEVCPIDRLMQRAGRLCRFNRDKIGELYILQPQKDGYLYPAPYGEYNRKLNSWEPCIAMTRTIELMAIQKYNTKKLIVLLNKVYDKNMQSSPIAKENARKLKEHFIQNWLIRPKQQIKQDDNDTMFWKSRNILPQESVYVQSPPNKYFRNKIAFNEWKISHSIDIPLYLVEKGRNQHVINKVDDIMVGNEQKEIYVIREGFYNYEEGLIFIQNDNNFL